jgi:hypothetical protein
MKMTVEHYNHIKSAIMPNKEKIKAHRQFIVNEGKAKDVEKRLRWDLTYYANLSGWICDNLYSYLDDTHVDTALRQIVREIEPA